MEAPTVTLANGTVMPALGLGTSPMGDDEAETTVAAAIRAGYRLVDTAENYRNERGVGRGIRASGVDRDEIFLTTKFNRRWHGYEEAQHAAANSAERLGLECIDLLLIHWPNPDQDRYVDAWRGMVRILEDGMVRRSASRTSSPPTSTGCSTRPGSRRTWTRSSSTRTWLGWTNAGTTPRTAS
jgi:2,5-diketo-D-gluconate reductase A